MANKYMKNLTLLAIMEMQIKITLNIHLTSVRMFIIKQTRNKQSW